MKLRLLDLMICPNCRSDALKLTSFEADEQSSPQEILRGILTCAACRKRYPVAGGIPRMLPDSFDEYRDYLRPYGSASWRGLDEEDRETPASRGPYRSTQESLSFEWLRYQVTPPEENRQFFRQATGLLPENLAGKLALDAGCGMGRFLEVAAGAGAEVVGLDLSRSVERAWRQTAYRPTVHLIQGNLMEPPLKAEIFDFIYSLGALHHTPDTQLAFRRLCPLLRPGGRISVWVDRVFQPEEHVSIYKRALVRLEERVSDGARLLTTRMPRRLLHYLCYAAVPLGWLKGKIDRNPVLRPVFWPVLLLPVSPHERWEVRLCDTFDRLAPQYQWKHTTRQVSEWFLSEGISEVQPMARAVGVSGVKPQRRDSTTQAPIEMAEELAYGVEKSQAAKVRYGL